MLCGIGVSRFSDLRSSAAIAVFNDTDIHHRVPETGGVPEIFNDVDLGGAAFVDLQSFFHGFNPQNVFNDHIRHDEGAIGIGCYRVGSAEIDPVIAVKKGNAGKRIGELVAV